MPRWMDVLAAQRQAHQALATGVLPTHCVEEVPGMPPRDSASPVLAGGLRKQPGLLPAEAARPGSP